ncbi:PA14 domain-containing protein [Hymenobacter glaciei]|uniref:PA14 domain-containing protein n=2 Tax=Hymenobacter glaciei TaxID=877209 RepID=A0ABP7URV9_9BACT
MAKPAAPVWAQAPASNGILGEYYEGVAFERLVARRHEATLAFDWGHAPPVPGVAAEYFSVRWTGWLVPPASGRYVLHATVDDGIRMWLNDQLVLNEWRPQPVRTFTTSIELKAGQPYKLRVDYYQDILDTRMYITWERPDVPLTPPPSSWRNLWGLTAETPKPEPIPTQFLYSRNPKPGLVAAPAPKLLLPAARPPLPKPAPAVARASLPVLGSRPLPRRRAAPTVLTLVPVSPATPLRPAISPASPTDTARLAWLAVGETVTLPDLFFEQGRATLLPGTRAALDKVAGVLSTRLGLRLEVQGHTDNVGNAELNRQLSQQRAEAVCLYLTAHGANTAQLRPIGYGGTQPVADNADSAQRPRNRRVVLRRL